jgi:hypothetical protein
MTAEKSKLINLSEDLALQKYIAYNMNKIGTELDARFLDIDTSIERIVSESKELDLPIESCPSFIEFSAKYSLNDTTELKSNIREFFKNKIKNRKVLLESSLDKIMGVSVPLVECLSEEGLDGDLEHALYFVGKDAKINTEDYSVKLSESSYDTVLDNLKNVVSLIEEFEDEEQRVWDNINESKNSISEFYQYSEIIRQLCRNINEL